MASFTLESNYYTKHTPVASISAVLASGPLAGIPLVGGKISIDPTHGKVVTFDFYQNSSALTPFVAKKMMKKGMNVTVVVSGKPEIEAIVAEAEIAVATEMDRIKSEAQALEPIGFEYVDGCDASNTYRLIWPDGTSEFAQRARSASFSVDLIKRHVTSDDFQRIAELANAEPIPLNLSSYGGWKFGRAGLDSILAIVADHEAKNTAARLLAISEKEEKQISAKAESTRSGKRIELARHSEECDGSASECDMDIVIQWMNPSGFITTTRSHTH